MTVKKDEFTIKSKRFEHPNATKYPGRPSLEFGTGFRNFLSKLSFSQQDELAEGTLIVDEEDSIKFFDSIQVGDVIGVGLFKGINEHGENPHSEPAAHLCEVLEIFPEKDLMNVRNLSYEKQVSKRNPNYKGVEFELAFEDLSCALAMGFGEILERNGKPYGVSEDIEYKIKVVDCDSGPSEQEQIDSDSNSSPPN